jgi:hypothetical protein
MEIKIKALFFILAKTMDGLDVVCIWKPGTMETQMEGKKRQL